MESNVWESSKRPSLLFNINLSLLFVVCLTIVTLIGVAPFGKVSLLTDHHFITCLVTTLALSFIAYLITRSFISSIGQKLCEKGGLFGRDLNKLGEQESKPKM
jgi:ABC-type sulfate transport system permease component